MMKARRDIRCSSIEIIDSGCGWIPAVISYGLGLPPQKRLCRGVQSRCCLLVHFGPRRLRRRKSEMPSMADIAVLRPLRFVSPAVTESMACRPLIVAAGGLRLFRDKLTRRANQVPIFGSRVKSRKQKYFAFTENQSGAYLSSSRPGKRGVGHRRERGAGCDGRRGAFGEGC